MHMTSRSDVRSVGRDGERGAALVVALMATMLLSALGLALILTTTTETKITGNYTYAQEALYAADAAIERTVQDVLTVPDWNDMLSGAQRSAFVDGAAERHAHASERRGHRPGRSDEHDQLRQADDLLDDRDEHVDRRSSVGLRTIRGTSCSRTAPRTTSSRPAR